MIGVGAGFAGGRPDIVGGPFIVGGSAAAELTLDAGVVFGVAAAFTVARGAGWAETVETRSFGLTVSAVSAVKLAFCQTDEMLFAFRSSSMTARFGFKGLAGRLIVFPFMESCAA